MALFTDTLQKYSSHLEGNYRGTDKITWHSYGQLYNEIFKQLQTHTDVHICELGTFSGGFAQAMSEFLPDATVDALDINLTNVIFGRENPKISYIQLDCTKDIVTGKEYDLIIDDASHVFDDQKKSLHLFAATLKKEGFYVIEDIMKEDVEKKQQEFQEIANQHGLAMQWIDLTHVKQRIDDILCVFRKL